MNEPLYSLKAVCKLTGLQPTTLHAWEKRYGAVKPIRTETNHRVYTQEDVDKLCMLVTARDLGHSMSQVAYLSVAQLKNIVSSLANQGSEILPDGEQRKNRAGSSAFCRRTLQALDDYDLDRVHDELAMARNRFETSVFVLEILVPLFDHLGKLAAKGKLSISKEHAISSIIKANVYTESLRLRQLHQRKPGTPPKGVKRFTLTTFDGDYHEFGILLASMLCMDRGYIVHNLGASTPPEPLAETVAALRTDVLILASPKIPMEDLRQHPREFMQNLSAELPKRCEIWIGGEDVSFLTNIDLNRKVLHIKTLHDLHRNLQGMADQA